MGGSSRLPTYKVEVYVMAKAGRPKGSKHLKPVIQGHVKRAILALDMKAKEGRGKNLTDLLIKAFEEDVLATLTVTAKYLPKEINSTKEVTNVTEHRLVELDDTLKQLHGMAREAADKLTTGAPKEPVSH